MSDGCGEPQHRIDAVSAVTSLSHCSSPLSAAWIMSVPCQVVIPSSGQISFVENAERRTARKNVRSGECFT